MLIQFITDILLILFVFVSVANSDSDGLPLSEEGAFSTTDFSLNGDALAFAEEPALPLDLTSLPSDGSDLLFEDSGSNTDLYLSENSDFIGGDQSFELAGFSSSSADPPPFGISKLRVRGVDTCRDPTTNSDIPPASDNHAPLNVDIRLLRKLDETWDLPAYKVDPNHNSICQMVTQNVLPWGVCSSGNPAHITEAGTVGIKPMPGLGGMEMWNVRYCTLGKFWPRKINPAQV